MWWPEGEHRELPAEADNRDAPDGFERRGLGRGPAEERRHHDGEAPRDDVLGKPEHPGVMPGIS